MFRLGLIVNPVAGLGGGAALRGSDGSAIQAEARARGALPLATARTTRALQVLQKALEQQHQPWQLLTWAGAMGADAAEAAGMAAKVMGQPAEPSTAADTREAAQVLVAAGCDLLLFAGGDGTARDICASVPDHQLCLGIPAGVKIHSGVYAVTPEAAGELLAAIAGVQHISVVVAAVRDIDEQALRDNRVQSRHFGELRVPEHGRFLQHVKDGGREVAALVVEEIAADVIEHLPPGQLVALGTGTTLLAVKQKLGLPGTLLGVDVVRDGAPVCIDATAQELETLAATESLQLVVTPIGGQGFIFGRGNQQFSPEVLRAAGRQGVTVVATRSKLLALAGRPLLVDTGDPVLDRSFSGPVEVVTGYDDRVLWQLGWPADNTEKPTDNNISTQDTRTP